MTLRLDHVARQLPEVVERYRADLESLNAALAEAKVAMDRWEASPVDADNAIAQSMRDNPRPYALSLSEPPAATFTAPVFSPMTVVAADGSSIEPDRFGPVQCFVVSTGAVVLPYGVAGEPLLESNAWVGPRDFEDEGEDSGDPDSSGGWGVNLQRDAAELSRGAELAIERSRAGQVALLLDGTLLPWDLDSPKVAEQVRRAARKLTLGALNALKDAGERVSAGAYVSGSRASEVVTSLRTLAREPLPGSWPPTDGLWFGRTLADGKRSAVFRTASSRPNRIETTPDFGDHPVCFFYLRAGRDIARVELPQWATSATQVGRLHAAIIDQCLRNNGYPRALQEAHEQAVISMGDRLQFSRLLENEAARQGLAAYPGGKQQSKRRRAV
jgi:hypothetical protein